jgi:hypothetical protein
MPGFDGTGPSRQGPMTGRGRGFCVFRVSEDNPGEVKGFAGLEGVPVHHQVGRLRDIGNEMTNMPFGDGTGPARFGPMTGRAVGFCAGFPVPGYMNRFVGRVRFYGSGVPALRPPGPDLYGDGLPYGVRFTLRFRRAVGLGRGFSRGWHGGRCRGFGYW